jgi:hypothetical protein
MKTPIFFSWGFIRIFFKLDKTHFLMGVKLPGLSIKHFFETVSIPIKTLSVKIFIFFLDYWQVPFLPLSTGFFQTNKVRDQLLHQYQ